MQTTTKESAHASAFQAALEDTQIEVSAFLETLLKNRTAPKALGRAMEAAVLVGGKRLRPFFHRQACQILDVQGNESVAVAAAIELIHCYSLVHDDLPCMDDAELRRGAPTIHVRFGENTALLAGNALLTLAFEVIASLEVSAPQRVQLIQCLARASGAQGMMAGQYMDLHPSPSPNLDEISRMQRLKTGALIEACIESALILKGGVSRHPLLIFGHEVGLAFQILDDLKDLLGHTSAIGKDTGNDASKVTFVSLLGPQEAAEKVHSCLRIAQEALPKGPLAAPLRGVVEALNMELQGLLA